MRISGVPTDITEVQIRQALQVQNTELVVGVSMTTIGVHPRPAREGATTRTWVLEGPEAFTQTVLEKGRLYIGWHSYVIRKYVPVTRCFKCERFGHVAKYCLDEEQTCSHCGTTGHARGICPTADDPPRCANCLRQGWPANHNTRDTSCRSYEAYLRRLTH